MNSMMRTTAAALCAAALVAGDAAVPATTDETTAPPGTRPPGYQEPPHGIAHEETLRKKHGHWIAIKNQGDIDQMTDHIGPEGMAVIGFFVSDKHYSQSKVRGATAATAATRPPRSRSQLTTAPPYHLATPRVCCRTTRPA